MTLTRRTLISTGITGVAGAGLAMGVQAQGRGRGTQKKDPTSATMREFTKQFRAALRKVHKDHDPAPLITLLQLQAAVIEDSGLDLQLQAAARKQGRYPAPANHTEMEQMLRELGGDELPFALSVHTADDPKFAGKAYEGLVRGDGLAAQLRATAGMLEQESKKWPRNGLLVAQGTTIYFDRGTCPVCIAADGLAAERNYICGIAAILAAAGVEGAMSMCITITAIWAAHASACYLAAVFGC